MPRLIVMRDPLSGGRTYHEMELGANLADELRRLFPEGFNGPWYLYKSEALPQNQLEWQTHPTTPVEDALYLIIVRPAGGIDFAYLAYSFIVSLLLTGITYLLTPKPKVPYRSDDERDSPNNRIAGQTNTLRAGARVPDILGKVRSWPDLLTYAVEEWPLLAGTQQNINQHFVIGVGDYLVEDKQLGDSPVGAVIGTSTYEYPPGSLVPAIQVVTQSPSVGDISLNDTAEGAVVSAVGFDGPAKTLTSPTDPLSLFTGQFVTFSATASNNNTFFVVSGDSTAPYVYTLDGPVVTEPSVTPAYQVWSSLITLSGVNAEMRYGGVLNRIRIAASTTFIFSNGDGFRMQISGLGEFHGRISNVNYTIVSGSATHVILDVKDMYGANLNWPSASTVFISVANFYKKPAGVTLAGVRDGPALLTDTPDFTGWFTAPLADPDEVWLDFSFPQGLVKYASGNRTGITISVEVEFKRPTSSTAQDSETWIFGGSKATPMRTTMRFAVNKTVVPGPENLKYITLPAGEFVDVRVRRATALFVESSTEQYVDDFRWSLLRSMVLLPARVYPDVYVIRMQITNTNSAASVGESSFNAVVTRKLPTWTGSAWSAPAATEKWADNLVQRMKAQDGANKPDSEIDLAGIYALQAQLDAMDSGDQGKISMTLDQIQDIDTELQTIAAVVRAQVYRVGRKLFVTRDEGGKTPLALFTGRSKHPDGEQVLFNIANDSEPDAVIVQWFDAASGYKQREYQWPTDVTPLNALRVSPPLANWAQAYRRARYEWNRIVYRRDTITLQATEEARLLHIGDVVNIADDVANLAQTAGELYAVAGTTLTLDQEVSLAAGGYSILLRSQDGRATDTIGITQGASLNKVVLARAAVFALKGRDDSMGTVYAIYQSATAVVRPWLITNLEPQPTYTRLIGAVWRTEVFGGDTGTIPPVPFTAAQAVFSNAESDVESST